MSLQPFNVWAPFACQVNGSTMLTPQTVSAPFLQFPWQFSPVACGLSPSTTPAMGPSPFIRASLPPTPGNLLRVTGGVPSSCMPSLGISRWGGSLVTEKTRDRALEIVGLGAPTASQDLSIHRGFKQWRIRQGLTGFPLGQTLAVFGAYLEEADLKHSTICEYVQSAHKMCHREGELCTDEVLYRNFLKGAHLLAANDKPDHAIDVSMERILEILAKLDRASHDEWRFTIWMMVTCGARMSDLRRLKATMISFLNGILRILFRVTKTSRDGSESYEVTVEQNAYLPFEPQWRVFLEKELPFRLKADSVNKILHRFGFPETTYSFRRFFIQATIARFSEHGHTEWCRVIEITGHQQGKTVRAKYALHVDDPVPGKTVEAVNPQLKRDRTHINTLISDRQERENSKIVGAVFLHPSIQLKLDRFLVRK